MNIVHFVFSMARGGQEKMLMDLALVQKSQGHQVHVLCVTTKEGPFVARLEEKGIPVYAYNKKTGFSFALLRRLKNEFQSWKIDVVHTHNPVPNFYGAFAARWAKVPVVVNTRHGMGEGASSRVYKFSLLFTNKVVFVCNAAQERFINRDIVKASMAQTIYNGVPLEQFTTPISESDKNILLEKLGLKPENKIIGLVARLEPLKDISTFLKVAKIVCDKYPLCRFLVVGDGSLKKNLKQEAISLGLEKKAIFLGDRRDVNSLLQIMDIFCLTSISEGMPLTLIEAMASGKPIVATRTGGVSEVVINKLTGYLEEPRDSNRLAKAIMNLINDHKLLKQMGNAGYSRVCKGFHVESMAKNYQKLYGKLMIDAKKRPDIKLLI